MIATYRPHGFEGLVASVILVAVVFVMYLIVELVDRFTESPAMRRRVNAASDKFLAERGSSWHAASQAASWFLRSLGRRRFSDL